MWPNNRALVYLLIVVLMFSKVLAIFHLQYELKWFSKIYKQNRFWLQMVGYGSVNLLHRNSSSPGPCFIKHGINNKMAVCWQPIITQNFSSLYQIFHGDIDFTFYETGPRCHETSKKQIKISQHSTNTKKETNESETKYYLSTKKLQSDFQDQQLPKLQINLNILYDY